MMTRTTYWTTALLLASCYLALALGGACGGRAALHPLEGEGLDDGQGGAGGASTTTTTSSSTSSTSNTTWTTTSSTTWTTSSSTTWTTSSSTTWTTSSSTTTWTTTTGPPTCDGTGDCYYCQDCAMNGPCYLQVDACVQNPLCLDFNECVGNCGMGVDCYLSCYAGNPEGGALFWELAVCVICLECPGDCYDYDEICSWPPP